MFLNEPNELKCQMKVTDIKSVKCIALLRCAAIITEFAEIYGIAYMHTVVINKWNWIIGQRSIVADIPILPKQGLIRIFKQLFELYILSLIVDSPQMF